MPLKVGFVSLGCPKNQVNAERMLAALAAGGMEIADAVDGVDAVVVNTCGFIDDAKREAIENILDMAELKREGLVGKLLVTGCLAERYRAELLTEIPEIDAVLGLGANEEIVQHVREVIGGKKTMEFPDIACLSLSGERLLTSPPHWAYLQIADGCSNCCSYCVIPSIRGPYRSRAMEDVLAEAHRLAAEGVKELILVAQDTTRYGTDLAGGEYLLAPLLRKLCKIEEIHWIRLLYCYPDAVTDELIEVIAEESKIVKYIDLPLQHADDRILSAMKRRGTQADLRALLRKLRERVPGIALRTTFITGFPGEDEKAFETLAAFVEEQRFDHMGVFAFSPQEGTQACELPGEVEPEIAARRVEVLMEQQAAIAEAARRARIGTTIEAVTEDYDGYTDSYIGRASFDAPEIDGLVRFTSPRTLEDGTFVKVEIFGVKDYDLLGRLVQIL
ncbi:MAG: 30S ribosomal protein S12 methylthiotransferase RimO [Oscillospiraceae bacterium]|nr:30S ribosomal protein S12 methylthiotransferase RimO [Oscillospiraceae bacterium]